MGWKSTIDITREEAYRLIMNKVMLCNSFSNKELEDMVEALGYGEDNKLEYYGYNFIVTDGKNENK